MDSNKKMTMVLADDEMLVRKGLLARLPVAEFGIEIVGVAENGLQALALCRELKPDILFCDIRMPHMDGLELAATLRDEYPDLRIIFFSGVQDFGYARQALEIQADGYILKPIHMDEVRRVLHKVVREVEMQRESDQQFVRLRGLLNENKEVLRNRFLTNLVQGGYMTEEDIEGRRAWYDLPLPEDEMTIVVVEPDEKEMYSSMGEEERQLLLLSMINIIDEVLDDSHQSISFAYGDGQIVVILSNTNEMPISAICEDIVSYIERYLQQSVSAGIGKCVSKRVELPSSYAAASLALKYSSNIGPHTIISIEDLHAIRAEYGQGMDTTWVYDTIRQVDSKLYLAVRQNSSQLLSQTLDDVFKRLKDDQMPLLAAKPLCQELICMAGRLLFEQGKPIALGTWAKWCNTMCTAVDVEGLQALISEVFGQLVEKNGERDRTHNHSLISSIQNIVQQKYMQNITVQSIAKEVHFSPNYISSVFRNTTGQKLNDYITTVRMEHAARMLEETNLRIFEVAHAVGFENAQYFSTVFKKKMGRHPRSYRNDSEDGVQ